MSIPLYARTMFLGVSPLISDDYLPDMTNVSTALLSFVSSVGLVFGFLSSRSSKI